MFNTSKSSKDAFPNERTARKNTDKNIIINVDFVMQNVLSGKHLHSSRNENQNLLGSFIILVSRMFVTSYLRRIIKNK